MKEHHAGCTWQGLGGMGGLSALAEAGRMRLCLLLRATVEGSSTTTSRALGGTGVSPVHAE